MMSQIAVITGGSSGLGYSLANILGSEGFTILILARDSAKIDRAIRKLSTKGILAKGYSCNITDDNALEKTTLTIEQEFGFIDYLILNAGVVSTKLVADYQIASELKQDLDNNLWGTILSAYRFLPLLKSGSKILIISSGFGLMGAAGYAIYCASKAGMINFGAALRRELLSKNIAVYVACPGDMDTPQFHEEIKNSPDWMKKKTPRKLMDTNLAARKILKSAYGSSNFLILPSSDVKILVFITKILPRKITDWILDKLFPRP